MKTTWYKSAQVEYEKGLITVEWKCPNTNARILGFKFIGGKKFEMFNAYMHDGSFLDEFGSFEDAERELKKSYRNLNLPRMGKVIHPDKPSENTEAPAV